MTKKPWYKQKTTWAGAGSILTGLGGVVAGQVDPSTALMMVFNGFMAIFGRQAVNK